MRLALRLLSFLRRNHALLTVVAILGLMAGLGTATGHWLFFRGVYLLLGLIVLSFLWARASLRGLQVEVRWPSDRLQVGQSLETQLGVRNASWYPRLLLEVEDPSDMPGWASKAVLSLPIKGSATCKLSTLCRRRGVFTVGPIQVSAGDPFGLFRFRRRFGSSETVVVYPRPVELPSFWAAPDQLAGDNHQRPVQHVTANAVSVREYLPGDGFSRIHWGSTARFHRLMVKTFETDLSSPIWVVLDLEGLVQAGSGDDSTEEYGVCVAASVAYHFLSAQRDVGLVAYGERPEVLEPALGSFHYTRLLEALALARARGKTPLAQVLAEEAKRFGRHNTLVIVTPSAEESWVRVVQSLLGARSRAVVVLLEPGSFGARSDALSLYGTLVASGIPTYLVRCGDDIAVAMGSAGVAATPLYASVRG